MPVVAGLVSAALFALAAWLVYWTWRRAAMKSPFIRATLVAGAGVTALVGYTIVNGVVKEALVKSAVSQLRKGSELPAKAGFVEPNDRNIIRQAARSFNQVVATSSRLPESSLEKIILKHRKYQWGCNFLKLTKGDTIAYRGRSSILYRPPSEPRDRDKDGEIDLGILASVEESPIETDEQILAELAAIAGSLVCERDRDMQAVELPSSKSAVATDYDKWGAYLFGEFVTVQGH